MTGTQIFKPFLDYAFVAASLKFTVWAVTRWNCNEQWLKYIDHRLLDIGPTPHNDNFVVETYIEYYK